MKTADLQEWFEDEFDCMDGPARTYIKVPNSATTSFIFKYVVYALGTKNEALPEEALCDRMYQAFLPVAQLPIEKTLFWRRRPEFSQEKQTVFGKLYATRMEVLDGTAVPRDAVEDFETNTWRENCGEELISKVTMRLVIPALVWWPQKIQFEKPETGNRIILLEELR